MTVFPEHSDPNSGTFGVLYLCEGLHGKGQYLEAREAKPESWFQHLLPGDWVLLIFLSLKLLHCLKEMILILLPNREVMVGMEHDNDAVKGLCIVPGTWLTRSSISYSGFQSVKNHSKLKAPKTTHREMHLHTTGKWICTLDVEMKIIFRRIVTKKRSSRAFWGVFLDLCWLHRVCSVSEIHWAV